MIAGPHNVFIGVYESGADTKFVAYEILPTKVNKLKFSYKYKYEVYFKEPVVCKMDSLNGSSVMGVME